MIKRLITVVLFCALAAIHAAGQNRFPPINLVAGDPTGTACPANAIVQSSTSGILYTCQSGAYHIPGGSSLPPTMVAWPPACTTGVYVPSTNTCVPSGTAANPGGATSTVQYNAGGVFGGASNSSLNATGDATYNSLAAGGVVLPAGFSPTVISSPAFYGPYDAINVVAAGAKGDGKTLAGVSMNAGSNILTTSGNSFAATDVGKKAVVAGAGPNGIGFLSTITGYTDAKNVTLADTASTYLVVGGNMTIGSPTLTTTTASTSTVFSAGDVGKTVVVSGATTLGTMHSSAFLVSTIIGYTDPHTVTLAKNADKAVTNSAGFAGHFGTDDHDAITRAINTALTRSSNPLSVYFPQAPGCSGCYYLTSTLTWRSVSMRGVDTGMSVPIGPSTLYSLPGQDLWNYPDPADPGAVTVTYKTVRVENMQWIVDNSIDASASHPHRLPGRTYPALATTTSGSPTLTGVSCRQGDIGQQIKLTYPDSTTQVTTVANCDSTPWGDVGTGSTITLAANATQTQTGVSVYISVADIPATQTIGNCALAVDNRDMAMNSRIYSYAKFHNLNIGASSGLPGNWTGGFCLQGAAGSGYGNTYDHIHISAAIFGFALIPGDVNPFNTNASMGCDFCRYIDWEIGSNWPFIAYNGLGDRIQDFQLAGTAGATHGIQIMKIYSPAEFLPLEWDISVQEQEGTSAGSAGWRLDGSYFNVHDSQIEGDTVWEATSSTCEMCQAKGFNFFKIAGAHNNINLSMGVGSPSLPSNVTSADPSNVITYDGGAIVQRPLAVGYQRNTTARAKRGDFLYAANGVFFNNQDDLWIAPGDIQYASGVNPVIVKDATSETTEYSSIQSNYAEKAWFSLATAHPVIGGTSAVFPAVPMTFYIRVKCPTLTGFTMTPKILKDSDSTVFATLSGSAVACSTSYTTVSVSANLTAYDGGLYYPAIYFTAGLPSTGEIDWAWEGWAPTKVAPAIPAPTPTTLGGVNSKTCSAAQHISTIGTDGSITCTADSGGGGGTITEWATPGTKTAGAFTALSNTIRLWAFSLPGNLAPTQFTYFPSTADNTANLYDFGIYDGTGALVCHTGATAGTVAAPAATVPITLALPSCGTLSAGVRYIITYTTNCASSCMAVNGSGNSLLSINQATTTTGGTTSGGVLNPSITIPADNWGSALASRLMFALH